MFVVLPDRGPFLDRHPKVHLSMVVLGVVVAVALLQTAYSRPRPPTPYPPVTAASSPALAAGVYWYLPTQLANDPTFAGARYTWIPPSLLPADPLFCADMNLSYYNQPTAAQSAAWAAHCPQDAKVTRATLHPGHVSPLGRP